MDLNEKPIWIYCVVLAIFISPTLFIVGIAVGSGANIPDGKSWEYISLAISALATFFIAILTYILAAETWRLRRNQDAQIEFNRRENIRPQVEVFLEPSVVSFQIILLEVENIGKGIAKNIKFEIVEPDTGFSSSEKEIIATLEQLSFFKNSLNILGVNKTKKSFLFSFRDMIQKYSAEFFKTELSLLITYDDIEGNTYTTYSRIDLSEFEGMVEVGRGSPSYRTADELEKIRRILNSIVSGNKRMSIDSYSTEDRILQKELKDQKLDQFLLNQKDD